MREKQDRISITEANAWVKITIPVGASDFLLGVENMDATFRIFTDNTLNGATQGFFVDKTGLYGHEGTTTSKLVIYISCSTVSVAILQYN